jgi:hypothetical protein
VPGKVTVAMPAHILVACQTLTCACSLRSSSLRPLLVCPNLQERAVFFILESSHIDAVQIDNEEQAAVRRAPRCYPG